MVFYQKGPISGWKDVCGYGAICSEYRIISLYIGSFTHRERAQTFLTLVMIEIVYKWN